jgi:L-alanine-DL-glutamate epimerase-like enolase superfamily enzyme
MAPVHPALPIRAVRACACTVPTDGREADATLEWQATTLVLVEIAAGDLTGVGYTYTDASAAALLRGTLGPLLEGRDALAVGACAQTLRAAARNLGRPGLAAAALSAVDVALWDLKAQALGVPLVVLLGRVREAVPAYASGGFCNYAPERLQEQLGGWAQAGFGAVKMKVARQAQADPGRVRLAREAIGPHTALFVDANGACAPGQALALAAAFAEAGVTWFEEPVSSDDRAGLCRVRARAPAGMDIAAGEYGYDLFHFRDLLGAGAVDALQVDVTRCGGYSGALAAAALADAHHIPLSCHCAPALHVPLGCALVGVRHVEYFHDHARIEPLLFEGVPRPVQGALAPHPDRPGLGLVPIADAVRHHQVA